MDKIINFSGNAQIEENVKGLCKIIFGDGNAQIVRFVNTISEEISNIHDTHFGANVNEFFYELMEFYDEVVMADEDVTVCYHYAMETYPISELVPITKRYSELKNAFTKLAETIADKVRPYAEAHFKSFVKWFSENISRNIEEV